MKGFTYQEAKEWQGILNRFTYILETGYYPHIIKIDRGLYQIHLQDDTGGVEIFDNTTQAQMWMNDTERPGY